MKQILMEEQYGLNSQDKQQEDIKEILQIQVKLQLCSLEIWVLELIKIVLKISLAKQEMLKMLESLWMKKEDQKGLHMSSFIQIQMP